RREARPGRVCLDHVGYSSCFGIVSAALTQPYYPTVSPHTQIVDAFQRRAALPADYRMAIAAHQGIGHRLRARRAIQFRLHNYFAAAIDSTVIVFVFSSSVPVTVTFLAANFSGVFWSLNLYAVFLLASYSTYLPPIPF